MDVAAAKDLGIAVCHVPAYSTEAVAQHVFALILELTNWVGSYNASVQAGKWYESSDFTFIQEPLSLLDGKSLGIVGYGNIGKRVARIAEAFGMKVNIYSRDKEAAVTSDFVTLHCPCLLYTSGFCAVSVEILPAVSVIAAITAVMVAGAILIGKKFGDIFESRAELLGGIILIIIGIKGLI